MGKYIRLLRLQDQFLPVSSALYAGILLHTRDWRIILWAIAGMLLSVSAFIVNGVTDRKDTDKYSWNPIHKQRKSLNMTVVWALFSVFSIAGLFISIQVGYFWWGAAIWSLGVLYSVKPVRLKGVFALDILVQLLAFCGLPYLAVTLGAVDVFQVFTIAIILSMIATSVAFPYEIADYEADVHAGLRCTHVVLGVRGSLWFGLLLGIIGMVLFFVFPIIRWLGWSTLIMVFGPLALFFYIKWLQMKSQTQTLRSIQNYSRFIRPAGMVFPFFLFIIWWFF